MKLHLAAISLATATVAVGLPEAAVAKTRLIVNCFWPPQHFVCTKVLPGWIEEVERVTEGRVTANIPPKSVAPPPEQLASVEKGLVDAAVQFNGLIGNRVTGALTAMQPFSGTRNSIAMTDAAWETNKKFYPDEFDTVELLSQWVITPGDIYSGTDTPIVTLEDFQSRKMWALPGPLANIAKELGAGVVATPAVQSNEVIANGVVDSHMGLSGDGLKAFQVLPYSKSVTRVSQPMYTTTFSFFVNKDKWAEISPEDQEAIHAISQDTIGKVAAGLWDSVHDEVRGSFQELGIVEYTADPALEAALMKAAEPITEAWLSKASEAGIDGQAALDHYQARAAELSQ
ncbi:hypothetical protein [uncultured Roseibium sp.]|uniref:hypothetical protein n=1 Tax=uncultured Roseibium sp. TaxID=1936171 RepID=UPI00260A1844|nr:hypothetical protein [uncultured Roseibium sp.]